MLAACEWRSCADAPLIEAIHSRRVTVQQIGKYTVVGVLGEGGMSTVYEAEDPESKRRVALKVLEAGLGASPRVRELFIAEMAILDRIRHPHVVGFLESIEVDGRLVMVLELLRGETLRELLRRCSRLAWPEATAMISQVLGGLSAAHSQQPPVVHRDLKPENIMITVDRTVKVMDFGIAKVIREGTRATTDVGTLEYMCPEQIEGMVIDQRADLYNVGLILYEMLTGAPPFRSQSTRELLNAQCTAPPPALPPEVAQAVPASLVQLMLHLLAKSPQQRPSSAEEVLRRLDAIVLAPGPSAMSMAGPTATSSGAARLSVSSPTGAPAYTGVRPRSTGLPFAAVAGSVAAAVLLVSVLGWLIFSRYASESDAESTVQARRSAEASENGSQESASARAVSERPADDPPEDRTLGTVEEDETVEKEPPIEAGETGEAEPTIAGNAEAQNPGVASIACIVDGRNPGVEDLVVLRDDPEPSALEWLDGATGEIHRTTEIEQYRIFCIEPHVLGLLRDEETKFDLLDVATGEVLSTTPIEMGLKGMNRRDGQLTLVSYADESVNVAIPEFDSRTLKGASRRVPEAKILAGGTPRHGTWTPPFADHLSHGNMEYQIARHPGRMMMSATRHTDTRRMKRKRLWTVPIDMKNLEIVEGRLTADDRTVSILRFDESTDTLDILKLDAETGSVQSEFRVPTTPPSTHGYVPTLFTHRGNHYYVHFRRELLAVDSESGDVVWRRLPSTASTTGQP
jgi:eukaryotic-like serine/threonine-protein kinase